MNYFLITKWFGCFLVDDTNEIIERILFPKKEEDLVDIISQINNGQILDQERKLANNRSLFVAERRLRVLGTFLPNETIRSSFDLDPTSFGFSKELLHRVLFTLTEKSVYHALSHDDYQIIQQVNALDELQHIANVLSERLTSWEMYPGNEKYKEPIADLIKQVEKNQNLLKKQIETSITDVAPNINEIVGPMIASRLIAHAGSLRKLAMLPASSIQLLGAEKALFRFKKKGGKPPKHGVIFQHPLIHKAPYSKRGKYARLLSAKITIAAKADMFTKRFIAPSLKEQLNDYLKSE